MLAAELVLVITICDVETMIEVEIDDAILGENVIWLLDVELMTVPACCVIGEGIADV